VALQVPELQDLLSDNHYPLDATTNTTILLC
jgi:hypothetical protein